MKVLVVTSEITFVPENYDALVVELAALPQVGGLLVLQNWEWSLFFKALGLMALGAPRFGRQLLVNRFGQSTQRRAQAYRAAGKPVWYLDTINCPAAVDLVKAEGFDLILNARTRYIYKTPILSAPRLGCVNIHHGLLPDQRGTMCDLWALYQGVPAGFTLHWMNEKIDAGDILYRVTVDDGHERDYLAYLFRASQQELGAVRTVLQRLERDGQLAGEPNRTSAPVAHSRNPDKQQIKAMKQKGLKL